jgi:hypothetical protein
MFQKLAGGIWKALISVSPDYNISVTWACHNGEIVNPSQGENAFVHLTFLCDHNNFDVSNFVTGYRGTVPNIAQRF